MQRRGDSAGPGRAHEQAMADAPVWDDGSNRLRVGRSQRAAEARWMLWQKCGRVGLGLRAVRAPDRAPHPRRGRDGRAGVGFLRTLGTGGHGAPTHEIMAQGRWKTARVVEVYTRAEVAGVAALSRPERPRSQGKPATVAIPVKEFACCLRIRTHSEGKELDWTHRRRRAPSPCAPLFSVQIACIANRCSEFAAFRQPVI